MKTKTPQENIPLSTRPESPEYHRHNPSRLTNFTRKRVYEITDKDMHGTNLKYPKMGWEMNTYMERSNNNDPTCICVIMNGAKIINFSNNPTENNEVIFTFGLNGCVAICLVVEMNDGTKKAILGHYSLPDLPRGADNIRRLGRNINTKNIKRSKIFVVAPEEYRQNSDGIWEKTIAYLHDRPDKESIIQLEDAAKSVSGANTEVKRITYSTFRMQGEKDQGTFRIEKGKDGKIRFILENYRESGEVFP